MIVEKRMKVPNGKLLVVKAEIKDDKIRKANIFGDFFFYPEDKLCLFEEAASSVSTDELSDNLYSLIEENNLELVGITVEAICELMSQIKSEIKMRKWRFLPFSENTAAMNMAIDESILEHVKEKRSAPTIRFYAWKPSAITIGNFQCRGDEVDMAAAEENKIDVVRRITGGGAVYHDNEGEITYSIIAPEEMFEKDVRKSYEQVCNFVIDALDSLGIKSVFKPVNDILVDNRKISGNAQTRRNSVFLQHGTILYDVDVDKMFSVLKVDKVKVSDKFVQSVKKVVTSVLQQHSHISKQDLLDALEKSFTRGREYDFGELSESEMMRAEGLVFEKYSSEDWNDMRR